MNVTDASRQKGGHSSSRQDQDKNDWQTFEIGFEFLEKFVKVKRNVNKHFDGIRMEAKRNFGLAKVIAKFNKTVWWVKNKEGKEAEQDEVNLESEWAS